MDVKNQLSNLNLIKTNSNLLSKRVKLSKDVVINELKIPDDFKNITFLPVEIIFKILSYLNFTELISLKKVSTFFEKVTCEPTLWKIYVVKNNDINTQDVIKELKRMPFLKKLTIKNRSDSDDILRQISLTNKNLEMLYIRNCTGSASKLNLRPLYLIRILERCNRLHTVVISRSSFGGLKFYRLLGSLGLQLKKATLPANNPQVRTYATFAKHISENDRQILFGLCRNMYPTTPMEYLLLDQETGHQTIQIDYLFHRRKISCIK